MKKAVKLFALVLVVALSLPTVSLASEPTNIVFSGRELESFPDEDWGILPHTDLFYMTANEVSDLLQTKSSGKYLTRSSLARDYVYFSGRFTHSVSAAALNGTRAGLCTYDEANDRFDAAFYLYFQSGVAAKSSNIAKSEFESGVRYYGFVKNLYPTGTVSSNLYVVNVN